MVGTKHTVTKIIPKVITNMVWEQDDSKHYMGRPADSPLVIGLLPLKKKLLLNPIWRTDTLLHQPTGHSQPSWTPRDNLANINRLRWCMPLSITSVILITFLILTNWGDAHIVSITTTEDNEHTSLCSSDISHTGMILHM